MASSNTKIQHDHWLSQHLGIVERNEQDAIREESPGRSRNRPIIVPGEEAPPLIIVESRDISPLPRTNDSQMIDSPKSDRREGYSNFTDDPAHTNHSRHRSRTLSPQPRTKHGIAKINENAIIGSKSIESTNSEAVFNTNLAASNSGANSDAITTPRTNRNKIRSSTVAKTREINDNRSSGDLSPSLEQEINREVPNLSGMASSLTSASNDEYVQDTQYLPIMLQNRNAVIDLSKKSNYSVQQNEQITNTKTVSLQNCQRHNKIDKQTSHKKVNRVKRNDVTFTGEYPSTPMSTTTSTPDIICDALRTGSTVYGHLDTISSPLSYSLSGVLRDSSYDTASFFHDFHNLIDTSASQKSTLHITTMQPSPHVNVNTDGESITGNVFHSNVQQPHISSKRFMQARSFVDIDNDRSDQIVASYNGHHDIANHSILQLCTEDLMSDDSKRVHAALFRLYEVCTQMNDKTKACNIGMKSTLSVTSAFSTSTSVLNRIRFIKAGGHALIVGVMKKYENDITVQASACRLIQQLIVLDECNQHLSNSGSRDNNISGRSGGNGAFNELFSAVYGMDCVIAVLQRFNPPLRFGKGESDNNDDVYNLACGALAAIVCSSFKMIDRLLQNDASYVSIFIKAMHAPINEDLAGVNRVIFYILKQYPQYVNEIVAAGGIDEVIDEMKQFPDIVEVQYCGCSALGTILKKNSRMIMSSFPSNRSVVEYIVNDLDGAHWIVSAMKSFPFNEDIQGKGVIALCNITNKTNTVVSSSLKKAGGISAIGIALENFPNNQTVQNYGCMAIKMLLECATSIPSIE
jgi:hypothetical protein